MSESIFQQLSALLPAGCVRENVTLAPYTTMRTGGPAALFAEPRSAQQLAHVHQWAQEKGLSYVAAESQERLETDKIALSEEEAIGYATVDKECGSVSNGSGCNVKTAFSADIRYIYRKTDGAITAIDNLADAKIYLPEVPGATAQISDPNIYQEERGFRISVTGTLSFTLENADVTQGGEFSSVETSGNQSNVITTAKTFAILFQQSDIQK